MTAADRRRGQPRRPACLMAGCLLLLSGPGAFAESVSLNTFYPSPSGVYTQLITTQNAFLARDGGKVGIGTINPAYKLDVNGDINATTLHVQTLTGITNLNVAGYVTAGGALTGDSIQDNGDAYVAGNLGVNMSPSTSYRVAATAAGGQWAGYFFSPSYYGLYSQAGGAGTWAGYFYANNGNGVYAYGGNGTAMSAYSAASEASYSRTAAPGHWASYNYSDNGYGVYGYGGNGIGVYGQSSGSWAGYFYTPNFHGLYSQTDAPGYWAGYFVAPSGYGLYVSAGAYYGIYSATSVNGYGVSGVADASGGVGIRGEGADSGVRGYDTSGYYGILAYSSYSLYGNGYLYGGGGYVGSDRRLKDDIKPLDDPLSMIEKLRPVSYTWKPDTDQRRAHGDQRDFGFIAQDVAKVLPEIVRDVPIPQNRDSEETQTLNQKLGTIKAIDYERVIPFVTGAVQQLHQQNQRLEQDNSQLKQRVDELERRLSRLESGKPLD